MSTTPYRKCSCFLSLLLLFVAFIRNSFSFPIDDPHMLLFARPPHPNLNRIEALVMESPPLHASSSSFSRRQRSSSASLRHAPQANTHCPQEHFTYKAYSSQVVLRVRADSMQEISNNKKKRVSKVFFKVLDYLKNSSMPIHDIINVKFANTTGNCKKDSRRHRNLVRADIRVSQEYVLFLNYSDNRQVVTAVPERLKDVNRGQRNKAMLKVLKEVCSKSFHPGRVRIAKLENKSHTRNSSSSDNKRRKIKLVCKVKGLPIKSIEWRHNNGSVSSSADIRTYTNAKLKTTSKLLILKPNATDLGQYECIVQSLTATVVKRVEVGVPRSETKTTTTLPPPRTTHRYPCSGNDEASYCLNGGTCQEEPVMNVLFCVCPEGFTGDRCDNKEVHPQIGSMYPHESYACQLGLLTKYYCLHTKRKHR